MSVTHDRYSKLLHDAFLLPIRASCNEKVARNKPGASKTVEGMWVNQTVIEWGQTY